MPNDWDHFLANYVPDAAEAYFGKDPVWTPAREGRQGAEPRPGRREAQDKLECSDCGGYVAADEGFDPIPRDTLRLKTSVTKDGSVRSRIDDVVHVCMSCQRSHYDGSRAMEKAGEPVSHDQLDTDRADSRGLTLAAVASADRDAALAGPSGGLGRAPVRPRLGFLNATEPAERRARKGRRG